VTAGPNNNPNNEDMVQLMPIDIERPLLRRFHQSAYAVLAAALLTGSLAPNDAQAAAPVSNKEKKCLAIAIYFEARGETEQGQKGVAQVILNRVEDDTYPDTICGVVYQNQNRRNACQFSFACDGRPENTTEPRAWKQAKHVAEEVLDGRNLVQQIRTATHYHASYVSPSWAPKMKRLSKIGRHIFYRT
jgi:spore germination cell wall hydrolase CwlJ-like protein